MLIHLCIFYECFCAVTAELSSCDIETIWAAKPKILTLEAFKKKYADPCSKLLKQRPMY